MEDVPPPLAEDVWRVGSFAPDSEPVEDNPVQKNTRDPLVVSAIPTKNHVQFFGYLVSRLS